jgi:glycosyltransferase involved in cell wall biosynthesis
MKVLLCHNYYRHPGGEDSAYLAERDLLAHFGHQVLEYVRRNEEIRVDGFLSKTSLGFQSIWADQSMRDIRDLLRRERPDIVHFHNIFPLISPGAYYPCRDAGVPVIQTLQNYRLACPAGSLYRSGRNCRECLDHSLWRGVLHKCYRQSRPATATAALMLAFHRWRQTWTEMVDRYIVATRFVRDRLVEAGLPAEKITVKTNFIYPDPGLRTGTGEYALSVSRLVPEKGIRTLLEAFRRLPYTIPLRIVGDGPLRSELEEKKNRENLSNICFEGWLPRQRELEMIAGARFLICPSEWFEPFGMTIIEAFACGVPVIASRLGGPSEIVEDARTGMHFTAGDSDDLAAKIQWAWEHNRELEVMGKAARAEYDAKYAAERNYQLLMQIYDETRTSWRAQSPARLEHI